MSLTVALGLSFVAAALVLLASRRLPVWALSAIPFALLLYFFQASGSVAGIQQTWLWAPQLGLEWTTSLDGLSLLFAAIITGVGGLVLIYSNGYFADAARRRRFSSLLLFFMASMLGIVVSGNLLQFYVFWELTTVASWLLIGFDHHKPAARAAAWQAMTVTAAGGLAMLAGFLLLGRIAGTLQISEILANREAIASDPAFSSAFALIAVGAFAKSAQAPLHFWLPNAMEAPTPASAYLHSATMVKAGVYLLARLYPLLSQSEFWTPLVCGVGGLSMLVGSAMALAQPDVKRALAYTTIGALGMMVMLLGIGSEAGVNAALTLLLAHALYKGALFLVAGSLDHGAGTRTLDELRGLRRAMPWTAAGAGLAWLSMAALPLTLGYAAHEVMLEALLHDPVADGLLTVLALLSGIFYVAAGAVVALLPFRSGPAPPNQRVREVSRSMRLPPLAMAVAGIALAIFSGPVQSLLSSASAAVLGRETPPVVHVWVSATWPAVLGALTIACGLGLSWFAGSLREWRREFAWAAAWGPECAFESLLGAMRRFASLQTRLWQHALMSRHLSIVVIFLITAVALAGYSLSLPAMDVSSADAFDWLLTALVLAGVSGSIGFRSRVGVITSIGLIGYSLALLFSRYGAPDLAVIQFLVETLFVVFMVLLLPWLPSFVAVGSKAERTMRVLVSIGFGVTMSALSLASREHVSGSTISDYFAEHSYTAAHGRNVVNVILVDFRGLDTLGEITALGAAAVGVHTLLRIRPRRVRG